MRKNQHNFVPYPKVKNKMQKRIETNISQLYGQFTMGVNLAKTFQELAQEYLLKLQLLL